MIRACRMHGRDEKYIPNFGQKVKREGVTSET